MDNELKLTKPDNFPDKKGWSDVDWVEEFSEFLQGKIPESITLGFGNKPKMSAKKAWSIIWYLQEHMPVLPDHIDKCDFCGQIYDSWSEGWYSEKTFKHYCNSCDTYIQDGHDISHYKCNDCNNEQPKNGKCKKCKSHDLETIYY